MPAVHQGTVLRTTGEPILNLQPPSGTSRAMQRREIDFINSLNAAHQSARPGWSELSARIASYELAFRLQATAPEALDLSQEDRRTIEAYGLHEPKPDWHSLALGPASFGRQCLIARRLVERGVRFVQIYSGGMENERSWDGHIDIGGNHRQFAGETDIPIAGLLADLKQRGLLESTLVICAGDFGRLPVRDLNDEVRFGHEPCHSIE